MPDTFAITVISVIAVTIIGMFLQRRTKDRCLRDFSNNFVTLEMKNGSLIKGMFCIESTGLEIGYNSSHIDDKGYNQVSYILYKPEFANIQSLIRFCADLDEKVRELREKELEEIQRPESFHRTGRKLRNFANTIRDSIMEIFNLFMGRMRAVPAGTFLTSQEKYITQARTKLGGQGTAFEPMLERHMGQKVVVEISKGDAIYKISGFLKEYTAEFIEIMDVDYKTKEDEPSRKADLIIPRSVGIVRHLSA